MNISNSFECKMTLEIFKMTIKVNDGSCAPLRKLCNGIIKANCISCTYVENNKNRKLKLLRRRWINVKLLVSASLGLKSSINARGWKNRKTSAHTNIDAKDESFIYYIR